MISRSALRKPERYISWKAASSRSPRVSSALREAARLRCDCFLLPDIPMSMPPQSRMCRAEEKGGLHALPAKASLLPQRGLRVPYESEMHVVCVNVLARDHPKQIGSVRKGSLAGARSCSRCVKGRDGAERAPH